MRFIPTRIHGLLDYGMAIVLIISPWLFRFSDGGPKMWVPIALGIAAIAYSLLTSYELGVVHLIPMPVHLGIDVVSGIVLALSPWIFGFADDVWLPHLILGLVEIGAGLTTQTTPLTDPSVDRRGFRA
ncbi:MAG TPA: SPW repeat protein [Thermomicrobiales bacterium]|nr:SPW repeat protein [Thermomicrobiales bacterium]